MIQRNGSLTHAWKRDWPVLLKGHASEMGYPHLGALLIPGGYGARVK